MATIDYGTEVTAIDGTTSTLEPYRGKVLLIVNTASECGYTSQYDGLEKLHETFEAEGLVVLGFPCNQFGGQEPGADAEIAEFCRLNFGVTFPMHAKIDVNGSQAHPLFRQLTAGARGVLNTRKIKWNFTKFLVGRDGTIIKRYGPRDTPSELEGDIREALSG